MTDAERLRKEQEAQQTINAYHRVFKSPDGERITWDLIKVFGLAMPAFLAKPDGGYDPIHAAKRDGQRDVYLHILAKLAVESKGDSAEKPKKRKVIK